MDISSFATLSGKRVLVVAEKPSAAKRIFSVLSKELDVTTSSSSKGKSKYNAVHRIVIKDNEIVITSVSGFIFKLEYNAPFSKKFKWRFNGTHDKRKWSLEELIEAVAHLEVGGRGSYLTSNKQIIAQIKELAMKSDFFVSATDNDFAGELIGFQAFEIAKSVNSGIEPLRMVYPSVTYADIVNA